VLYRTHVNIPLRLVTYYDDEHDKTYQFTGVPQVDERSVLDE
jgi:hypothetical protein